MTARPAAQESRIVVAKRYWWIAATLAASLSGVFGLASSLSNHLRSNVESEREIRHLQETTSALSSRVGTLADVVRTSSSLRDTDLAQAARIEAALHQLTTQVDKLREDLVSVHQQMAVERERVGFIFDFISPAPKVPRKW
jgi:peptidoglycan hydrolase CwlO-like protein